MIDKKFHPDKDWYIKSLVAIQNDIRGIEGDIKSKSVCEWEKYRVKFDKIINGLEVITNVMESEKEI